MTTRTERSKQSNTARKLLILDRDGVINEDSAQFIKSADEWLPIPGSIEAVARLSQAGYLIAVATNQSGLARGLFQESDLSAMHQKMLHLVEEQGGMIDGIFFCPHGPDDHCDCRKPAIGLLRCIEKEFGLPLKDAILVGDSLRDIQAGQAAGCKSVLLRSGKGEQTLRSARETDSRELDGVEVFADLASFADVILAIEDSSL